MIEETPQIWVKALKKRGKQFPHKSARFDCCLLRKGSASNRMMPSGGSRNSQFSCIVRWDFCAATWVESSRRLTALWAALLKRLLSVLVNKVRHG
eukprot:scaffold108821_cov19-Tisochrysis_lutea.AAC.1